MYSGLTCVLTFNCAETGLLIITVKATTIRQFVIDVFIMQMYLMDKYIDF